MSLNYFIIQNEYRLILHKENMANKNHPRISKFILCTYQYRMKSQRINL